MIRGLMIDCARLTERHEFYHDLLDQMAQVDYNCLWWHFVDDQGFVLKLDGRPELATPYAFGKAETRRLVDHASQRGIDIVPEVETFGHARYATRLPQYRGLAAGDPQRFNSMCPSEPATVELLEDIIGEVCALFPSPFFHAGLDEVDHANCPLCAKRYAGRPPWYGFAEHVKAVHRMVASRGKRMMMWADHVVKHPEMLKALPKDIVMIHWQYLLVDPEPIRRSLAAGFEVMLVPSMLKHRDMVMPNASSFDNLRDTLDTASSLSEGGLLGVVQSWWWPQRAVRGACLPMVALTGRSLKRGSMVDPKRFFVSWTKEVWEAPDNRLGHALYDLHHYGLTLAESNALFPTTMVDVTTALQLARAEEFGQRSEDIVGIVGCLDGYDKQIASGRNSFDAVVLAAKVLNTACGNGEHLLQFFDAVREAQWYHELAAPPMRVEPCLQRARQALRSTCDAMENLRESLLADWDRTRHARDVKRLLRNRSHTTQHTQHLAARVASSAAFFEAWRRRFDRAVDRYVGGGPFPALLT